ncbi:MAG: DUF1015 domain-containing protein [Clostridiales bacterium]|jgi:hypothetical protein|nr:DUF1015 domain-containing protein [Clostridiales bacterium]
MTKVIDGGAGCDPFVVKVPEILLPKDGADYSKWACIACDQFTSEAGYWKELDELTRGVCSTYHITYPEIFLGKDEDCRIEKINAEMQRYLDEGVFKTVKDAFILVERTTKYSDAPRYGLMIAVDLEAYDFKPFNKAYIKATEGTILERLPVRIKIREHAPLEFPHIMLLADDDKRTVIEPLAANKNALKLLYDFELNQGGGHIRGYKADDTASVLTAIYALADGEALAKKYGRADCNFLFAVGDGNHSLATAKACWERLKPTLDGGETAKNHPARYALVELVNIYDDALKFEPIHRVVFDAGEEFLDGLKALKGGGTITAFDGGGSYNISVSENAADAIRQIQEYIEAYAKAHKEVTVDYIHGEEHLREVAASGGGIGIVMPSIKKRQLFPYVVERGVLPKKAFSMGEAEEKRYYLEAKRIK